MKVNFSLNANLSNTYIRDIFLGKSETPVGHLVFLMILNFDLSTHICIANCRPNDVCRISVFIAAFELRNIECLVLPVLMRLR